MSVVMVCTASFMGFKASVTALETSRAVLYLANFLIIPRLVFLSTMVNADEFPGPMISSISQSPNRFPSAQAGRSSMLFRFPESDFWSLLSQWFLYLNWKRQYL